MRVPRWGLIAVGILPVASLFALLVWGVARQDDNPGGLLVFGSTGEAQFTRRQAPDFTLTLFDGTQFNSESLRGQVVMVDFWASWCPPCRFEARALEAVWRRYKDRGVAFVGVDIWDKESRAVEFLEKTGTSYIVGVDPKGEVAVSYGVTGIPEKYFLDSQGQVRRKIVGPMSEERLSRVLDDLLAKG